jgi:dTDP-4-dehydrorhamnose 3,5-epimerase
MFTDGTIEGVLTKEFRQLRDNRGWLAESFRIDELGDYRPEMGYVSVTFPNVTRGPHEHKEQTDYFCFLGKFTLFLWDNRTDSPTYRKRMVMENVDRLIVVIPPGIVHAYRNSGDSDGMVLNFPNRLYAGWGKKETVDEVRYENDPKNPYVVEP